jgi:cytochrome c553
MRKSLLLSALFILGLGPALAAAAPAGDPKAGQAKAFFCGGCHGIPGWRNAYPDYREPKLGGQHAEYLVAALKAYQSGLRNHSTMHAIAASLSDQDMADLAAYFSAQDKQK